MLHALLITAWLGQLLGADDPTPCQARIRLRQEAQLLTLTSFCQNLLSQPVHYRYRLEVWRRSSSGQSQNTQGGEFTLLAQQTTTLSTVRLSCTPTDSYRAKLVVFDDTGHTIATDSVSQPAFQR